MHEKQNCKKSRDTASLKHCLFGLSTGFDGFEKREELRERGKSGKERFCFFEFLFLPGETFEILTVCTHIYLVKLLREQPSDENFC